ncbi:MULTISPECIES: hypothetical protein [Streptomyces]|uniref:hypothetical protein n=1 Tax=Streptomyces TaxID=1883 RepID=UPI000F54EA48|nr:hypothetical protein [Streptomyces sp. ADI96-15]RPK54254.1 hypothetical protein EES44_30365 [Streptomyces sp. ADI96-15]
MSDHDASIWPETLQWPQTTAKVVFLDLNHWIALAQAHTGHARGAEHQAALNACRDAQQRGKAVFVLTDSNRFELQKKDTYAKRADVAAVMEELTGFATLPSRFTILKLEFDAAVTSLYGPSPRSFPAVDLVGPGVGWAIGQRIELTPFGPDGPNREELLQWIGRENEEKFDALLEGARVLFERLALEGLTPELSASLEAQGWDRKLAEKIAEEQAQSERDLTESLALLPSLQRQLERLVPLREFIHGMTFFDQQMRDRGMDISALANDPVACLQVIRSMPSMNVTVDLKVLNHQMKRSWKSNDIFDINTLAVAMPYTDVVLADKHYAASLRRTQLDRRLNTTVLSKLTELTDYLAALSTP